MTGMQMELSAAKQAAVRVQAHYHGADLTPEIVERMLAAAFMLGTEEHRRAVERDLKAEREVCPVCRHELRCGECKWPRREAMA